MKLHFAYNLFLNNQLQRQKRETSSEMEKRLSKEIELEFLDNYISILRLYIRI